MPYETGGSEDLILIGGICSFDCKTAMNVKDRKFKSVRNNLFESS